MVIRPPGLGRDWAYLSQNLRTSLPLLFADLVSLWAALLATDLLIGFFTAGRFPPLTEQYGVVACALVLVQLMLNLYPGVGISGAREIHLVCVALTAVFGTLAGSQLLAETGTALGVVRLAVGFLASLATVPLSRRLAREVCCRYKWWAQPAMIFGGEQEAASDYRVLTARPHLGLRPVGIVDDLRHHWRDMETDPHWYLGNVNETDLIAEKHRVFWGVVAMSQRAPEDAAAVIDRFALSIPRLLILPDFDRIGRTWDGAHEFGGRFGAQVTERLILPMPRLVKRTMDVLLCVVAVTLLSPLMLLIAVAVKLTSKGPVFYRQTAPGVGGRRFRMWKFRTMQVHGAQILRDWLTHHPEDQAEWDRHHKLRNDPRVTAIGRILRRSSLDELPQIFNVLLGHMSLVGPRPYPLYECEEMQTKAPLILKVRPGITGLWQVSGRSAMTFPQRLEVDVAYVRNWSLWLDLIILARTLVVVAKRSGAY